MNIRMLPLSLALALQCAPASPQETKKDDPAAKALEEGRKRLAEIDQVQDDARRSELLEQYIRENPKAANLDDAQRRLLGILYKVDAPRAVALADEILARPRDPKSTLWKDAYGYKFQSLSAQLGQLAEKVLESESDPRVLNNAASFDRGRSRLKLLQKAIAERDKNSDRNAFPRPDDLRWELAARLSEQGMKDEASKQAVFALEISEARIAEVEALPKEDPKRKDLDGMRRGLSYPRRELASLLAETGEPERALAELKKAEDAAGPGAARDQRSMIEELRGRILANMGKPEEALESYTRAFAFRMTPTTRDKILRVSSRTGKPSDGVFTRARELRREGLSAFPQFDLKTHDGKPASLDSLKGKVTLVNFFFPT
jgi:hypothetical protein